MQTSSQQNQAYKQQNRQNALDDAYDDHGPHWGGGYYNYPGGAARGGDRDRRRHRGHGGHDAGDDDAVGRRNRLRAP